QPITAIRIEMTNADARAWKPSWAASCERPAPTERAMRAVPPVTTMPANELKIQRVNVAIDKAASGASASGSWPTQSVSIQRWRTGERPLPTAGIARKRISRSSDEKVRGRERMSRTVRRAGLRSAGRSRPERRDSRTEAGEPQLGGGEGIVE